MPGGNADWQRVVDSFRARIRFPIEFMGGDTLSPSMTAGSPRSLSPVEFDPLGVSVGTRWNTSLSSRFIRIACEHGI